MAESISPQRFNMLLLATFAGLALVLAAMGIYSVLSYAVRRRVREIGIRMALGAQIRDVLRLIVFEGMKPALVGLGIGLTGRPADGTRAGESGVRREDEIQRRFRRFTPADRSRAAGSACPAYRATRVDPMSTLRDE